MRACARARARVCVCVCVSVSVYVCLLACVFVGVYPSLCRRLPVFVWAFTSLRGCLTASVRVVIVIIDVNVMDVYLRSWIWTSGR